MKASDFSIADCDKKKYTFPNKKSVEIRGLTHEEHGQLVALLKNSPADATAWAIHKACDFEGGEEESITAIKKWPKKVSQEIDNIISELSGYSEKKS